MFTKLLYLLYDFFMNSLLALYGGFDRMKVSGFVTSHEVVADQYRNFGSYLLCALSSGHAGGSAAGHEWARKPRLQSREGQAICLW